MEDDECDFDTLAALLDAEESEAEEQQSTPSGGESKCSGAASSNEDDELKVLYARIAELEAKKTIKQEKEEKPVKIKESEKSLFDEATCEESQADVNGRVDAAALFGDDDSDWEDLEGSKPSNLSDAGKELNSLLRKSSNAKRVAHEPKCQPKESKVFQKAPVKKEAVDRKPQFSDMKFAPVSSYTSQTKSSSAKPSLTSDSYYEREFFSNIRIRKPLVSSMTLQNLMKGRQFVAASNVAKFQRMGKLEGDWATIGVIVSKSEVRKSAKGNDYLNWRVSALKSSDAPLLQCFLFGAAFKKHWKISVGAVVGILNASSMSSKEAKSDDPAMMVDNDQKILHCGHSKDFALCRSKTKAGKACTNHVNREQTEYCTYHIQSNYKKHSAKRADIQSGFSAVQPKSFEKNLFNHKNSTFSYGGQTYTSGSSGSSSSSAAKKSQKGIQLEDLQRHYQKTVNSRKGFDTLAIHDAKPEGTLKEGAKKESKETETFMEMLCEPTPGSMQYVKYLKDRKENKVTESITGPKQKVYAHISVEELLKTEGKKMKEKYFKKKPAALSVLDVDTPCLGRGLSEGNVDLDLDTADKPQPQTAMDKNKYLAMKKIRSQGGIKKPDPNAVRKRKSEKEFKKASPESSSEVKTEAPLQKKPRLLSDINLDHEEMKNLIKAKSAHDNLLTEEEAQKMEDYFEALEKTEKMENAMLKVTQIKCKAVTCEQCKYKAFAPSQMCKDQGHKLTYSKGIKRFFACMDCKHRTVTLERYPKETCGKCGGSSYKAASMMREKKGPKLSSEELALRGEETPYLNSLK